jgi:hypothetical protein
MFELLAKINLVPNVVHINVTEPSFGYKQVHSPQYEKKTYTLKVLCRKKKNSKENFSQVVKWVTTNNLIHFVKKVPPGAYVLQKLLNYQTKKS